jgi:uncharacterized protein YraI
MHRSLQETQLTSVNYNDLVKITHNHGMLIMKTHLLPLGTLLILLVGCVANKENSNQVRSVTTNCNAEITGSIRSEPSSQAGNETVLGSGGSLPVTGAKTEGGWIQVRQSDKDAWVYSEKISNFSQLQSQNCFSQTVSDAQYIKSKPKAKSVDNPSSTSGNESSNISKDKETQECKELIARGISDRDIERCEKIGKTTQKSDEDKKNNEEVYYKEKYGGDLNACIKGVEYDMRNIGYGEGEPASLCKKRKSEWGQLN